MFVLDSLSQAWGQTKKHAFPHNLYTFAGPKRSEMGKYFPCHPSVLTSVLLGFKISLVCGPLEIELWQVSSQAEESF